MKKLYLALLAICGLAFTAQSQNTESINVNGSIRYYVPYVPENLGTNRPLLISMHGMNQDANYQRGMLQIESIADTAKFLTIFPEGEGRSWDISGNKDIDFVLKLIDEMVEKYSIDPNRVYLSGFSMGGMFTYHAMTKIAHKIAAFAPISGYPMGGSTFQSSRPVPIIHTHGTGDDVVNFDGVANVMKGWRQRNECPETPEETSNYRNHPGAIKHVWGPGKGGVEVVLLELADKGHWIANDYFKTGEEIWNFCKRYSLDARFPDIRIDQPLRGTTYTVIGSNDGVDGVKLQAYAKGAKKTKIVSVKFYGDDNFLGETTEAPYEMMWTGLLSKGKHVAKIVVVDENGATISTTNTFTVNTSKKTVGIAQGFAHNSLPAGWRTYDGATLREGPLSNLINGCRVLSFSNGDFPYGLYVRNTTGNENEGYGAYGAEGALEMFMLTPGTYTLSYNACNWNMPNNGEVRCVVSNPYTKEVLATKTVKPTCNIGNSTSAPFSGSTPVEIVFSVGKNTTCQVEFFTENASMADLVVGNLKFTKTGTDGIEGISDDVAEVVKEEVYDAMGRLTRNAKGLVIVRRTYSDGTVRSTKEIR